MAEWFIKPGIGRVLVEVEVKEKIGSLYIPATANEDRPTIGTVAAIYDNYEENGVDYEPMYKVGDKVIFGKWSGSKVTIDGKTYIIMMEKEIVGHIVPVEEGADLTNISMALDD